MSFKSKIIYKTIYIILVLVYFAYYKFVKLRLRLSKQLSLKDLIQIRDKHVFRKKTDHIAFIVNYEDNEPLSDNDLIKLISWSIIFRIPYITVYDHDGLLIERREAICSQVCNYLSDQVEQGGKLTISPGEHERTFKVHYIENECYIKLRFIRAQDGKEKIVQTIQSLIQERLAINNNNSSGDLSDDMSSLTNASVLNNKLREEFKFPDPDMAVICSSIYNVYGYPPWEIRYTEFVLIPDLQNVNIRNFHDCFVIFNQKEQRKGR